MDHTLTLDDLPGPWAFPLLGHLPRLDLARMHLTLERWAAQYGPLYRLRLGAGSTLVLSDPALIAQVLRDRPAGFRRLGLIEPVFREIGAHGVFSAAGADWQRQRRLVMQAFNPAHLNRFFPQMQRVTQRLLRRWQAAAANGERIVPGPRRRSRPVRAPRRRWPASALGPGPRRSPPPPRRTRRVPAYPGVQPHERLPDDHPIGW